MDARLPAHLEVSGLLRSVQAAGGFAMVLHKGEREGGTIVIVCTENGTDRRIFERMPSPGGDRKWVLVQNEDIENKTKVDDYLMRRTRQDRDLWIIELDIADGERFIGLAGTNG